MIEGNFTDISLPAMLQLLCLEAQKSFRVGVALDSQRGEIYVRKGWVIAAIYGILEGEDAVCEFMSWRDGVFWAEQVTPEMAIEKNLSFAFQPNSSFVQDCAYLAQSNAGLNSVITGSILYGSTAWKEAVRENPLDREALSVLAWLREGRTTHQAMREFGFDIVKAASILTRLLITRSVDVVRCSLSEDEPVAGASLVDHIDEITTGGQEAAAAKLAQEAAKALESAASVAQEAFLSTSFKSTPSTDAFNRQSDTNPNLPKVQPLGVTDPMQARSSMEARLRAKRGGTTGTNLPAYSERNVKDSSDGTQTGEIDVLSGGGKDSVVFKPMSSPAVPEAGERSVSPAEPKEKVIQTSDTWLDDQPPTRSSGLQALLKNALEKSKQIASERIGSADVDTSDTLPVLREGPTIAEAREQAAASPSTTDNEEVPASASTESAGPVADSASLSDERASLTSEKASLTSESLASEKASLINERASLASESASLINEHASLVTERGIEHTSLVEERASLAAENASVSKDKANLAEERALLANENAAGVASAAGSKESASGTDQDDRTASEEAAVTPVGTGQSEILSFVPTDAEEIGPTESPKKSPASEDVPPDDPRFTSRTVSLPLVALDIERLLQATFTATQFGKLALGNPSLDSHRRQTLLDAEQGKPLANSLDDGSRPAATVLSSYRYCLDRGYIETHDPVIPLTADLLLGRMEIDQYLLQRRRITGDQLRDLIKIARQEGLKLPQLLMRSGFLTEGDIETLDREQKRFAFK
jgi:hypothetical protein